MSKPKKSKTKKVQPKSKRLPKKTKINRKREKQVEEEGRTGGVNW